MGEQSLAQLTDSIKKVLGTQWVYDVGGGKEIGRLMRHQWRSSVIVPVFLAAVVGVPSTGWPKGEQTAQITRLDHGVARGIVKAAAQAVLYAQVQGRVSMLPYKEGQRFEKGAHAGPNRL